MCGGVRLVDLLEELLHCKVGHTTADGMGCPGGCVNGGGQPRTTDENVRKLRAQALYREDEGKKVRMSHENPAVQQIYAEYLGEPCGERSHHLLHTTYVPRGEFNELLREA